MIIYPNTGALWGAGLLRTALATSEIHLFKAGMGVAITPALVLADLEAAEADYTGYAAEEVTAFAAPLLNPLGGASIDSGSVQFAIASPYTDGNVIGGGWIQTSGGVLVAAWDYDPTRSLTGPGDGVPVDLFLLFG